eukprot:4485308-Lingulodinium_polyedra.AAC.1
MPWVADAQRAEVWPTYDTVVNDTVSFTVESDVDIDTNTSEDSGRKPLDLPSVVSLPDAQQIEHIFWAYRTAKKAWRRTT